MGMERLVPGQCQNRPVGPEEVRKVDRPRMADAF